MLGNNQEDLDLISGDVVIATDRMSTYPVLGMKKFQKRFYFVQDYEPYFFARGSSSILTEQSYASEKQFFLHLCQPLAEAENGKLWQFSHLFPTGC